VRAYNGDLWGRAPSGVPGQVRHQKAAEAPHEAENLSSQSTDYSYVKYYDSLPKSRTARLFEPSHI